MKKIIITILMGSFAVFVAAQKQRLEEKQKQSNAFLTLAENYTAKAKAGTLSDAELSTLTKEFKIVDSILGSYYTGEDDLLIFRKYYRMRCLNAYTGILNRVKHYSSVDSIAQLKFQFGDDPAVVDVATLRAAHMYDYGDRKNDKYDIIVAGGMQIKREAYVDIVGNLYTNFILGTYRVRNYQLMDSLFLKGLKYGYFDNKAGIISTTIGRSILSVYKKPEDYNQKFLDAATFIFEGKSELTPEQLSEFEKDTVLNKKIDAIFNVALLQDINTTAGITAYNTGWKYFLNNKRISDEEKAAFIRTEFDRWASQTKNASAWWLMDGNVFRSISYFITQLLLDQNDQVFGNKLCAFVNEYGATITKYNPLLVYNCYLYYKKSGQSKIAKKFYKQYLELNYKEQYPK
ncbi:hypothetical protein [Polluticaenibacter yanchengensis]|uniref:Uncharacterized protein n=1 Tax=Polluticaenibacter yanchengensis TaxID=3014562 RepID=A0ABT4UFI3_9BACT|nr:hypothetical protein [Chitinophagaceae bacterium LY-5]